MRIVAVFPDTLGMICCEEGRSKQRQHHVSHRAKSTKPASIQKTIAGHEYAKQAERRSDPRQNSAVEIIGWTLVALPAVFGRNDISKLTMNEATIPEIDKTGMLIVIPVMATRIVSAIVAIDKIVIFQDVRDGTR